MKRISYLMLFCLCLLLIGCGNSKEMKEVSNLDTFNDVASKNGFTVEDNINSYLDIDYISESMKATLEDIAIEMVIYTDNDSAIKVQDGQIDSFKTLKATGATEHKEKGENYYKFWMVSNGYYMVSSRIDNTLIFSKTLLQNKEKVENILDNMRY